MSPSVTFAPNTTTTTKSKYSVYTPPQKKQKMSITQTYFLAHSARGKLSREAARADHDLRLLVGHANMLDSLMIDLANAEQEQERWFNRSVNETQHEVEVEAQHEPTIMEEVEEEESEDESDAEDDLTNIYTTTEMDVEMDEEEADEDLVLTRTASRHSPPELTVDFESDSDDDHMPPSPPTDTVNILSEKQRQAIATTSYYETKQVTELSATDSQSFHEQGFFLPSRSEPTIIAAY